MAAVDDGVCWGTRLWEARKPRVGRGDGEARVVMRARRRRRRRHYWRGRSTARAGPLFLLHDAALHRRQRIDSAAPRKTTLLGA